MDTFKIVIIILILIVMMNNLKPNKMFNKMFNKIPKKVKSFIPFLLVGAALLVIMKNNKNIKIDLFSQEDTFFEKAYKGVFGVKHLHLLGEMGGPDNHLHEDGDTPIDPITGEHQHRVSVTLTPEPLTPEPLTPEPLTPEPLTPEPLTPEPLTPEPLTLKPEAFSFLF